jgi:hypothetical protein
MVLDRSLVTGGSNHPMCPYVLLCLASGAVFCELPLKVLTAHVNRQDLKVVKDAGT